MGMGGITSREYLYTAFIFPEINTKSNDKVDYTFFDSLCVLMNRYKALLIVVDALNWGPL